MHFWVRANSDDFAGNLPQPRSGHTAVNIGKSKVVVFGGFFEKKFLNNIVVYDIEKGLWFQPECTGSGTDGQVGPSPRAFHIAVSIDCHMFIFGGRLGNNRLGDFWVLDTDIWQWSELTSYGDLPSPRDFASASAIANRKIVMYGGWDGKKWLSDVFVLDTISCEWTELPVTGTLPPPRCGHTATMVEKRLLVYGGRGGGGPIMGDLWALKGLIEEENETPAWTQLKLPGQAPSARCGHTVTSGGHILLLFGGHGTGGWLSRYDIYYNDCTVLDRVSAQWKRLPTGNEPPAARAYHSLTSIGSRYLLFGGFDGKTTFGDLWWLVPQEDPISKRWTDVPQDKHPASGNDDASSRMKNRQQEQSAVSELQKKLGISISLSGNRAPIAEESQDKEFIELAYTVIGDKVSSRDQLIQGLRNYWRMATPDSVRLKELGPLIRDYQRLITRHYFHPDRLNSASDTQSTFDFHFYHVRNVRELRMNDIPKLLEEYKQLPMD